MNNSKNVNNTIDEKLKNLQRQEAINNSESDDYNVSDDVYNSEQAEKVFVENDSLKPGVTLSDDFGNEIVDSDPFDQEEEFEDDFGIPAHKKTLDVVFDKPDFEDDIGDSEESDTNDISNVKNNDIENDEVDMNSTSSENEVYLKNDDSELKPVESICETDENENHVDEKQQNNNNDEIDKCIEKQNKKPSFIAVSTITSFVLIILSICTYYCIVSMASYNNSLTNEQMDSVSFIELSVNMMLKSNSSQEKFKTLTEQYIDGYITNDQYLSEMALLSNEVKELVSIYESSSSEFSDIDGYDSLSVYVKAYIINADLIIGVAKNKIELGKEKADIVESYNLLNEKRNAAYSDITKTLKNIADSYNIEVVIENGIVKCNIPVQDTKTGSK